MKLRKLLAVVLAVAMVATMMNFTFASVSAEESAFTAAADKPYYVQDATINVTVTAPSSVAKVYLANEVGTGLASERASETKNGVTTWTLTFALGTVGSRTLSLFADGVDTGVKVTFDVVDPFVAPAETPAIISVDAPEVATINGNFAVTIKTNTAAEYVALFNESGNGLVADKLTYTEGDVRTWILLITVGSTGSRTFVAKCCDGSKQWTSDKVIEMEVGSYVPESVQKISSLGRQSVHDPSIVKDKDGTYYIFGSNQGIAKTTDLMSFSSVRTSLYGSDVAGNLAGSFDWAGYKDGSVNAGNGMALWAPDVIWNPYYVNADKSLGAYMIYYPVCSNHKRGAIGYAVSQSITGIYTYVDTVLYSGFTLTGGPDAEGVTKDTIWTRTNLPKLIENGSIKKAAEDKIPGLRNSWFLEDGSYNITNHAEPIDPTVFFDKDGELWMVWGGGMLSKLDKATGAVVYPGVDGVTEGGDEIDRYFGIRIGGGFYRQGEGVYIVYDKATDYYYMTLTYGQITEGYNQRLFRAKNVTGPYLDAAGNKASFATADDKPTEHGIKIMGNYQFSGNTQGYKHGGHNSLLIDDDGAMYNVYHQRFASGSSYQDRIHQMFINAAGWPCMAVYENRGDKISETGYAKDEILGWYEIVNHGSLTSSAMLDTLYVKLNADGTVTGDYDGTWTMTEGTYYMTLTINDVVYTGIFFKQTDESGYNRKVMTFSAIGTNNEAFWGSRMPLSDNGHTAAQQALAKLVIPSSTNMDIALLTKGEFGSDITWISSNPAVLSASGKITRGAADQRVTLTAVAQVNGCAATKNFTVTVKAATAASEIPNVQALYNYTFTTADGYLTMNLGALKGSAIVKGNAEVITDSAKGLVLKTSDSKGSMKLPSDALKGMPNGFTVSMWVNSPVAETYPIHINNAVGGQMTPLVTLTPNVWTFVSYTISKDGIKVYKDGTLSNEEKFDLSDFIAAVESTSSAIQIGSMGSVMVDDVTIYGVILTAEQVNAMIDPNIAWQTNWQIDFGTPTSALWGGFTQMTHETIYDKKLPLLQAYGVDLAESEVKVDSFATSTGGAKICDFIYGLNGGKYVFKMELPNGQYRVFMYSGAKDDVNTLNFTFQDETTVHTQVTPEGVASDNYGGPNTYTVNVTNGVLKITMWGDAEQAAAYAQKYGTGMSGRLGSIEITKLS